MALTDKLTNIANAIREKTGSTRTMNLEGMAAAVTNIKIPTALSDLNEDETHRTVTDAEKKTWNNKSDFSGNYDDLKNKPTIPTIPEKLPNPNALTFTGAVEGSYDGSAPLSVEIPSGGGSGFDKWECINTFTIPADTAEDVTSITFSEDVEGKPFALKKFYAVFAGIIGLSTYFCIRINNLPFTQQFGTDIITKNNTDARNPLILYFEIAGSGLYHWSCPNVKSFGYRADGDETPNGGTQSNISQVNKISFLWGTSQAITPGTTVKLWGVRT